MNPDEPHTYGHGDDKAQNTKQKEEKNPLGGLHLEQDNEVFIEALTEGGLVTRTEQCLVL